MAKIITAKILVDDDFNEKMLEAFLERKREIIDFSTSRAESVNVVIDDSIVNGTYAVGDAFNDWLVFRSGFDPEVSYWSSEYGWDCFDLATRFDSTVEMPAAAKADGGIFVKN